MFENNILAGIFLLALAVIATQALIILARGYYKEAVRNWFYLSLFVCFWLLISWRVNVIPGSLSASYYFLYNLFILLIPVFYLRFISNFLNLKGRERFLQKVVYLFALLLFLVDVIIWFYNYIPRSLYPIVKWGHFNYYTATILIYFILGFLAAFYLIVKHCRECSGIVKRKIRYIFFASLFGVSGGILVYLPILSAYNYLGICVLILAMLVAAYALTKHPLAGFKEVVSYLYIYFFVAAFVYVFHQLAIFIGSTYLGGVLTTSSLVMGIFISVVFSLIFLSFLRFVQETSDLIFYRGRKPNKIIKDFALKINKELDFEALLKIIKKEFKNTLGAEEVKILILKPHAIAEVMEEYSSVGLKFSKKSPIFKIKELVISNPKKGKGKNKQIRKELQRHGFEVAVPLLLENDLRGIIFLGEKHLRGAYTEEDLDFLKITSSHASVAIHNALLCEELEECNVDLEKEVKEKMQDIEEKNERLQHLLKSQTEFLDIASHQLRTPMSVIKGMLSMMKERSLTQKKRNEFLKAITQNAFRLEEIIETILTASELDSGNFGFELGPVQLKPLLKSIQEKEKMRAEKKHIKFKTDMPRKYILPVLSNESYLKQVIETVVDNAFQYTQEGSVTVRLVPEQQKIDIEVEDTGIGIPQKERNKIFNKFSRCRNAVDTYGNGSGLGLFVAEKIIKDHHRDARIYVKDSQPGKGTTFVISLPTVKND